ncbi:MAG: acyl-ACP--UDP-N-acetylglucosamine O-acyltransferase [Proteobacteria bacterium]|nr:acyl-ACP--UDP-N-acetylglucosamine O-acyltransferase [Pseudomonadota bacterium]
MTIHPTALVEEGAVLGAGCIVHAHAIITRHCVLGDGVVVHPFTVIGGDPQDLSFDPGLQTGVRVGARTVLREHVTVSRATKPGTATEIGADCYLMASSHVAHDCRLGDRVIMANAVLLAGHVHIGERVFMGGAAAIHQFVRIGEGAMIGGVARITRDVPPFTMATERDELVGLNVVGLRRRGTPAPVLAEIKAAFRATCGPVGNARELAAAALAGGTFHSDEARRFLEFFAGGRRGFLRTRGSGAGGEAPVSG